MTDTMCPIQRQAHRYLVEQSYVRPCECDDCARVKTLSNTISEALKNMAAPKYLLPEQNSDEVVN